MNPVLFSIVFGLIMFYILVSIWTIKESVPVAKAGKVSDFYPKEETIRGSMPHYLNVDGKRVDVSEYIVLYVHGESMKRYKIHDKQKVFVRQMFSCVQIDGHPVLVLRIVNPKPNDAEYKLRKFVCLLDSIDNVNWNDVFENNKNRISISKDDFIAQCKKNVDKHKDCLVGKIVLSETFDVAAQKDCYSLHPLSTVFGTVEYAA